MDLRTWRSSSAAKQEWCQSVALLLSPKLLFGEMSFSVPVLYWNLRAGRVPFRELQWTDNPGPKTTAWVERGVFFFLFLLHGPFQRSASTPGNGNSTRAPNHTASFQCRFSGKP